METERLINFMNRTGRPIGKDLLKHLKYIENLPSGARLLNNINNYFYQGNGQGKSFSIDFINSNDQRDATQFYGKDPNNLKVIMNRNDLKSDSNGYYIELPEIMDRHSVDGKDVFQIGSGRTYEPMILAHELTHLNHYIQADNKEKAQDRFGEIDRAGAPVEAKTPSKLKTAAKYPELTPLRLGRDNIFTNKEERKTVWGGGKKAKTDDDISELSLRLEAGLNPRYLYQGSKGAFLESYDNLIRSVGLNKNKIELSDFLQQKPYTNNRSIDRIKGTSDFIKYTPVSILKKLHPLDKRIPQSQRLHRLMLMEMARNIGYTGVLDNITVNPGQKRLLMDKTSEFMQRDKDSYKRSIDMTKSQKQSMMDLLRGKYPNQFKNLTEQQISNTVDTLLNDHIGKVGGLSKLPIQAGGTINAANQARKTLEQKLNRKVFKEFISNTRK